MRVFCKGVLPAHIVVRAGDTRTVSRELHIPRYADGVDLGGLAWSVRLNAGEVTDVFVPRAVTVDADRISFEWVLAGVCFQAPGTVTYQLEGVADPDTGREMWQSGLGEVEVLPSISATVTPEEVEELTELQGFIVYVQGELEHVVDAGASAQAAADNATIASGKAYTATETALGAAQTANAAAAAATETAGMAARNANAAAEDAVAEAASARAAAITANKYASEAQRVAAKLENGTVVAEVLKNDPAFVRLTKGAPGGPGDPGADGVSVTHEWHGTVLTVTSASGTSSADLRGPQGDPGTGGDVTREAVVTALGYTPASLAEVAAKQDKITDLETIRNGAEKGAVAVSSVKVAGTALERDEAGAVNVPLASGTNVGVVAVHPTSADCGIRYWHPSGNDWFLALNPASTSRIESRTGNMAITPPNLDFAVKCAMSDGLGAAWSASEQAAARERIGAEGVYELIETITYDGSTAAFFRNITPDGRAYNFVALKLVISGNGENAVHSAFLQVNGDRLWYGSNRTLLGHTYSETRERAIIEYDCVTGVFISVVSPKGTLYQGANVTTNVINVNNITSIEFGTNGATPVAGATCKIYARWSK